MAPPFKMIEFDIMYGEGVSKMGELLDFGVKAGIVEKSGSWFSYDSQRIGQGRETAKTFLRDTPEVDQDIEDQNRDNAGVLSEEMMAGPGEMVSDVDGADTETSGDEAAAE